MKRTHLPKITSLLVELLTWAATGWLCADRAHAADIATSGVGILGYQGAVDSTPGTLYFHVGSAANINDGDVTNAQGIVAMYREQFPEAMKCLATDLDEVLTALRFPDSHRERIRTTNLLERLFGEGKRRSKVIPRSMSEKSGLSLMFAVLVDASASWRGVEITTAVQQRSAELRADSAAVTLQAA